MTLISPYCSQPEHPKNCKTPTRFFEALLGGSWYRLPRIPSTVLWATKYLHVHSAANGSFSFSSPSSEGSAASTASGASSTGSTCETRSTWRGKGTTYKRGICLEDSEKVSAVGSISICLSKYVCIYIYHIYIYHIYISYIYIILYIYIWYIYIYDIYIWYIYIHVSMG